MLWLPLAALWLSPAQADDFSAKDFFQNTCSMCHGPAGHGDGPAAAALDPKPANFTDPAFWKTRNDAGVKKVLREGAASIGKSPVMAAYGASLTDPQLDALVAYLKTLR